MGIICAEEDAAELAGAAERVIACGNFADLETEIVDAPFVQVSSTTRQTILPESFQ